ncbi:MULTISPECIES: sortase domain-bontaining protein [unclassified Streptomyces]|uniref:Sortase n=1 Tax=Streptomyces sp. NBC_00060 TaxID=2975636 RepID=A0AAU2GR74_9ACTN
MPSTDRANAETRHNRASSAAIVLLLTLAATGMAMVWYGVRGPSAPEAPPRPDAHSSARSSAAPSHPVAPLPAVPPRTIRIPGIGVDSAIIRLDSTEDTGMLPVPQGRDEEKVGWYSTSSAPGAAGTAALVGHLDSRTGPSVFYRLGALRPGQEIVIERADGSSVIFTVRGSKAVSKAALTRQDVLGDTQERSELRLVTCGGSYVRGKGYDQNVLVYADLVGGR